MSFKAHSTERRAAEQQGRAFIPLQHLAVDYKQLGYFGKRLYQQGEVLTIVDGKFRGFVGTVVSSNKHNITGHLVLRRMAKGGALHQQEIFFGQEKEDLKAQIREVLDLERFGGMSMTTDELVKSLARKGALAWGCEEAPLKREEAQLKRQGVEQITIELIEEHWSQAIPVQLEEAGNFPAFYGSELLSVHQKYARCFVSLEELQEELSLQPPYESPYECLTCPASLNYLVSVALKDGNALADISLECNHCGDYETDFDPDAVSKHFDTVVSLLYCLLLLSIYVEASL